MSIFSTNHSIRLYNVYYRKDGIDMKKFLICILCFSLVLPSSQTFVYASEVPADTKETSGEKPVEDNIHSLDLSDYILKEGGLLTESKAESLGIGSDVKFSSVNDWKEEITDAIYNVEDTCDLSAYEVSVEALSKVLVEVANENPRYFYVDFSDIGYTIENDSITQVKFTYEGSKAEVKAAISEYDEAINEIISGVSPNWSDMEKALYINDYLTAYCEYDLTYSKYDAYNIIVEKTGVCQAYAEAYQELMTKLGVTCELVVSHALNHAWNMVLINDKYYQVDTTWNDPIADKIGRAKHQYFMKSTEYFKSDEGGHTTEDWYAYSRVDTDLATDTTYDAYFWNEFYAPFQYANGKWYTTPWGKGDIISYTCDGKNFSEVGVVATLESRGWEAVGFSKYGNYIYCNSSKGIYAFNPATQELTAVYMLSEDEQKTSAITGMRVLGDGTIEYTLGHSKDICRIKIDKSPEKNKYTYTIKYVGNGSTSGTMSSQTMEEDTYKLLLENTFVKEHYEFVGWNTKADGSGVQYGDHVAVVNLSKKQGETVKLYAQWKPIEYEIYYILPSDTKNNPKNPLTYTIEDEVKLYAPTTKLGDVFKGWYIYSNKNTYVSKIPKGTTGRITLYADCNYCSYNIVLDGNGSTSGSSKTLKNCLYGKEYKLPKNPYKRKGYAFVGWNTKANGKGKSYDNKAKVKNLTKTDGKTVKLYAQWKKTKYTITYVLQSGGKNNSKNPTYYYVTSSTKTLKAPTRKGYTFKGWYSDSKYKNKVTKIKKGSTGNKTFYAKWAANKYNVKFDGNGATSGKMSTLKSKSYGKSYELTANRFKRKGYTFAGWNTKADGSGKSYKNKASIKNLTSKNGKTVTLYAQWKKK